MFFDVSAKRRLPSYDGKNKPNMHRRVVWRFCVLFYIKLTYILRYHKLAIDESL